jgi:FAD synthase
MKIRFGLSDAPVPIQAVAVVGTWDPVVDAHRELFQRLALRGKRAKLSPLVIILHPSPARLVNPDPGICLEYSDIKSRIALIRECARVNVLVVQFKKRDLNASASSFFSIVDSHSRLRELWLGTGQSLGRGQQGSDVAIRDYTRRHNISLKRLPYVQGSRVGGEALRLLGKGEVKDAIKSAGHAPIWRRPRSGVLHVSWPPGEYLAIPMAKPSFTADPATGVVPLRLSTTTKGALPQLDWPGRDIEWLAFLAGPADKKARRQTKEG